MLQQPISVWTLGTFILAIGISTYIFRWLLQKTVAWSLRRRTRARRNLILARVKLEESQLQISARQSPKLDDGEWEKVEKYSVGSAPDVKEADDEWEGTIGFFHPFWFVVPRHGELDQS